MILFHERGTWTQDDARQNAFSNVFRWTADADRRSIRLEHLRFGPGHPVYLFDLVPAGDGVLESSEAHVCQKDLYAARMEYDEHAIRLTWTITGLKKLRRFPMSIDEFQVRPRVGKDASPDANTKRPQEPSPGLAVLRDTLGKANPTQDVSGP